MKAKERELLKTAIAYAAAESIDPSTQTGALLFDEKKNKVVSIAANRFPKNVKVNMERLTRPLKYSYILHAEHNAILQAAKKGIKTEGLSMYCLWFACANCAQAIVEAGIKKVIGLDLKDDQNDIYARWKASCEIGDSILTEGGVEFTRLSYPEPFGIQVLRDGKKIIV